MKKVLIIVGHQNIKFNSLVNLRGNTGTAGELPININVGNRVSELLRQRGVTVVQTDANGNDDKSITSQDFNLALSLHCNMNTGGEGGMCGSGDPSVDLSWKESARIKKVFDENYFKETGIKNNNYVTEGMTKWYMWQYLSDKTPCVLLEMGEAKDPHDSVLLGNTELIATAITRSICLALGVSYGIEKPSVSQNTVPATEFNALKGQFDELKKTLDKRETDFPLSLADCEKKCQEKLIAYKKELIKIINL